MLGYKLYCVDGVTKRIVSAKDLTARDDLDALDQSEKLCETHDIELWHGTRYVARFNKGNAPLRESDRLSL